MNVVFPETPNVLTHEQNQKQIRAMSKIKGQTCTDSSTKRGSTTRDDTSSPNISLEALI